MRFVLYDFFVLLCWNQRDNLIPTSEFERGWVQLITTCGRAFNQTNYMYRKKPMILHNSTLVAIIWVSDPSYTNSELFKPLDGDNMQ